jgi:phospholipid transport system substrate-binding protein
MRARHFINGLAMLLFASLAMPCEAAEAAGSPGAFVTELAHKAPLFMSSRTLTSIERQRRLEGLLEEYLDMPRIARFVLGNYWRSANDTDRRNFTEVLRDVLARTYSDRFTRYNRESFRVTSQRDLDAANTVVSSEVGDPVLGEQAKVEWIVARGDGYRIIDIIIAGASMAKIMHDDFGSYLKRNGGDLPNLIRELRAKLSAEKSG